MTICFNALEKIFNTSLSRPQSTWEIVENDSGAKFKKLTIMNKNKLFEEVPQEFYKNSHNTFLKAGLRKASFEDLDCDGFAFTQIDGHLTAVLVELKSSFNIENIFHAFEQIVYTYVKLHTFFSLCEGYPPKNLSVKSIIACKPPTDETKKYLIDKGYTPGKPSDRKLLFAKELLRGKTFRKAFKDIGFLKNYPLHPVLGGQVLDVILRMPASIADESLTIDVQNNLS